MQVGRRRGFRSLIVEPYKQVKLGLIFLLINTIFSVLILSVFAYFVLDIYHAVTSYFQLTSQDSQITWAKFNIPIIVGTILIVLFIGATLTFSIVYTHQIYGPLVSIHRYLDEMLKGRAIQPLQLRESDQLKELAGKLSSVAERLSSDSRAGPLVPIHRFLDDLLSGKRPEKLQLRDSDQFRDLATKLNGLLDRIH